jgi:hypothetical protein
MATFCLSFNTTQATFGGCNALPLELGKEVLLTMLLR